MTTDFFQAGPELGNQYQQDPILKSILSWKLPSDVFKTIEGDLNRFGERVAGEVWTWARKAEQEIPRHIPYDPWGRRIDEIVVSDGWKVLHRVSAEEGLVAIGYERQQGEYSRLYQFAKLYLFHPSSAFYSCPLAMADGAARALEVYGDSSLKKKAFIHLTSRDPQTFWTSGQWMTERTGGSDVSETSTIAKRVGNGFELHGVKWFSSATTSEMALTLARLEGAPEGSRGLSLFYVEVFDKNGKLNGIEVLRLKDKLGTHALPTAELALRGTQAQLVGEENQGVKSIATMLNVTRLYNSICAVGQMRRGFALANDYANKRKAFGRLLKDHALHVDSLAEMQVALAANLALTLHMVHLMGREETGKATTVDSHVLRLLTPITKLYTAKQAVGMASEAVESFGGAGYIEDTGLPVLLRDAQVFPIWEGTTNVLSLDVLRVLRSGEPLKAYKEDIESRLDKLNNSNLKPLVQQVYAGLNEVLQYAQRLQQQNDVETAAASSRSLALALGQIFIGSLLIEWADHAQARDPRAVLIAQRHCEKLKALPLQLQDAERRSHSARIIQ